MFCSVTGNPYSATKVNKKAKGYVKEYYFPMKTKHLSGLDSTSELEAISSGQYVEVEVLEAMVEEELKKIAIKPEYVSMLVKNARWMFEDEHKVAKLEESNVQKQIREITHKLEKLEDKYIVEETITKEVYLKHSVKFMSDLKHLEKQVFGEEEKDRSPENRLRPTP